MEPVLVDAVRTPFGRLSGGLSETRTDDLAAIRLRELVRRNPELDPVTIDEVVLGNANGAGEDNRDVARMAALLAGFRWRCRRCRSTGYAGLAARRWSRPPVRCEPATRAVSWPAVSRG